MSSQISSKPQTVYNDYTIFLPREIRKVLQLGRGDQFRFVQKNGNVCLVKVKIVEI